MREKRSFHPTPAAAAGFTDTQVMSHLYPGGKPATNLPDAKTHYELSSNDVSEGKRLYHWFNCHTCHASGGGDIGPALMDDKWLYGSDPRNIYQTILEGRPNGMPSFRGKIPDEQVWQIVAYVKSMSGHVPIYAPSSREDDITAKKAETLQKKEHIKPSGPAIPDSRSNSP
ncbi:MAG: c-type cytochrome [Bacteriovoracaceae bacterium]